MEKCGWCGIELEGEGVFRYESSAMFMHWGDREVELIPAYECGFCSQGCAWLFLLSEHKLMGMSGFEAHKHIIEYHGIVPDSPFGQESVEHAKRSANLRLRAARRRGIVVRHVLSAG
jgi:hypothetical protein